jgi:hypothetical protein
LRIHLATTETAMNDTYEPPRACLATLVACLACAALFLPAGRAEAQSSPGNTLVSGRSLTNDGSLLSKNGKYRAVMQKSDGNFVVYEVATQRPVWSTGPTGGSGWTLAMQADGNLVVYDTAKSPKWASNTDGVQPAKQYFLQLEDSGELNIYKGTPSAPLGTFWNSKLGLRFQSMDDVAIARVFRPQFRFKKDTKCWGLAFSEAYDTREECNDSYDPKFVVFAHVTRPAANQEAIQDRNTFRITYSIAFGEQQGTYSTIIQNAASDLDAEVGHHGEDAQYMVVDVVNGAIVSAWADIHTGYYSRARSGLSMANERRIIVWVGPYCHPFKFVRETTSICKSEWEGWYGLTENISHPGLRFLCAGTCGSSRSCMPTDTVLNWGDPSGEDTIAEGQLVMVNDACEAAGTYESPDGTTYSSAKQAKYKLYALKAYLGCTSTIPSEVPGWSKPFKKNAVYTDPYGLEGCKTGKVKAGDICNASYFGEGAPWMTSRPANNKYIDPTTAGSADPDYAAGGMFNDLRWINGTPRSITLRTGKRVDAVSTTFTDGGIQGHGGTGGGAITLEGLDKDPIVRVELCEATKNGKVRLGHIKVKTYSGTVKEGGDTYDDCRTIAPYGKMLYGFYGRAGKEVDLLGTIWGDLPPQLPAKETSW